MAKLILMCGPSGSGKSTLAKSLIYDDGDHGLATVYINQDSQGRDGHVRLFLDALADKKDIIVDRMSFSKEQRARYLTLAKQAGYETEIRVLHVPFDVCMKRCLDRIGHETIKTEEDAQKALNFFFKSYERVEDNEADVVKRDYGNLPKTDAIICDLDGTMCNIDHRLHYVRREGKRDWNNFFKELSNDKLNEWCFTIINALKRTHKIILCSGRPDDHKTSTIDWLRENMIIYDALYMRKRGDFRADTVIKEIILDFEILPRYNILFSIDDRKNVVDMWRARGITCLACAEGNF